MDRFEHKLKLALENIMDDAWKLANTPADQIEQNYNLDDFDLRQRFTKEYGWSLPCKEAVKAIEKHSKGQTVYDVMAGSGYWAKTLRNQGINAIASDIGEWEFKAKHVDIDKLDARRAAGLASKGKPIHLLLSWPPHECPISHRLLHILPIGSTLYLIGEGPGGCTGSTEMFDELDTNYERIEAINLPQWSGIHDYLEIYKKVKNEKVADKFHDVGIIYLTETKPLKQDDPLPDIDQWKYNETELTKDIYQAMENFRGFYEKQVNIAIRKRAIIIWQGNNEKDTLTIVKNGKARTTNQLDKSYLSFKPDYTVRKYQVADKITDHLSQLVPS
jgi:hypothetical protein